MDTEQQIRLNFLDEADEYFEQMESYLLGLANTVIEPQTIDQVLRSTHSVKGGAAMMGFNVLNEVAHRLEDFLKILRVRYIAKEIDTEVETLLLESVDCLRAIGKLNRQEVVVKNSDVYHRAQQVFEQLREYLGDLETQDEDALMTQNEDIDPALLIFEEGVNTVLDQFEIQLHNLEDGELSEELATIAEELIAFGNMTNIEPFVQLSRSIKQQVINSSPQEIALLAKAALTAWRRSHALVLRGSIDKLPSCLEHNWITDSKPEISETVEVDSVELNELQSAFELDTGEFEPLAADSVELNELQSAFELDTGEFEPLAADSVELNELQSAFELDTANEISTIIPQETNKFHASISPEKASFFGKMAKVPAAQLQEFNNLFEQLILDRNAINLRLKQLQNVFLLMSQRINQMENSNTQLKQWYDRAGLEEWFLKSNQGVVSSPNQPQSLSQNLASNLNSKIIAQNKTWLEGFDSLEMDRYSDIHLICQEQIETIVQLKEVATDLELEIQAINQAVRNLNYTSQFMQGNLTRTQMLPFAEIVKRFPRIIRDLNLKYDKQVKLEILGENTLLDRTFIKPLSDSLIHLLRNSFDHGIEDKETRIAKGKSASGTITIEARNRGTYTLITFKDDGCGISLDQIRDRISQMGIPASEVAQITAEELLNFIFEPGFSTAEKVTELSGRGVGMDIVRANLQDINGDVRVMTEPGEGTSFILRIPCTLSILRVAVIEQAGMIFAIPANSIQELVADLESIIIQTSDNIKYINWHGAEIPLLEIEKTLVYSHPHKNITLTGNPTIHKNMALVVGDERLFAALQISYFWQEQESTIRPIDSPIPLPPGVISSVVFGDGKVIPLIDPILLIEECLKNNSNNDQSHQNFTETQKSNTTKIILVIDDSINIRRYLSLTLEKAGYQVEEAKDGQEALDKLLGGLVVQAIICDIEMPRLDGYTFLEEVKDRAEFKHIPVAMLTSRSNEKHQKLALNLGASAYFAKPYNEQKLLAKLAEFLE